MSTVALVNFIHALFLVYYALIFVRVLFSWMGIPQQRTLLTLFRFVYDVTEPYLGLFRRFIPSFGGIDFSPFIAILALFVIERIIVGLVVGI